MDPSDVKTQVRVLLPLLMERVKHVTAAEDNPGYAHAELLLQAALFVMNNKFPEIGNTQIKLEELAALRPHDLLKFRGETMEAYAMVATPPLSTGVYVVILKMINGPDDIGREMFATYKEIYR